MAADAGKKWDDSQDIRAGRVTDIGNSAAEVTSDDVDHEHLQRTGANRIWHQLFMRKSFAGLLAESEGDSGMRRCLTGLDLMLIGIGAIIGTGIFVLAGVAAGKYAGPGVVISFIIAGIASAFAGLCYTELATMIPISGSAYTFTYATCGEFVAWIIGWDLLLEYMIGTAAVSVGWSAYFRRFFAAAFNVNFDPRFCNSPVIWDADAGAFVSTGNYLDLPAAAVCILVTIILVVGIKESAWVNHIIVAVKVAVVILVICIGFTKIDADNYSPFIPPNEGGDKYGFQGVMRAAVIVFFAYIGFDAVTCMAQEAKVPQRDLPIGVLGSLGICTVLYILMSIVLVGVLPYQVYANSPSPISLVAETIGGRWLNIIVTLAALSGLTSVMLVTLMGQPRIFYSMAKDGLLPKFLATIHPRFQTPYVTTIITGGFCAVAGALLPVDVLADMSSIGTLFAFTLVSIAVIILRIREPNAQRLFKCWGHIPYNSNGQKYEIPIVPFISIGLCVWLMSSTGLEVFYRFVGWLAAGLVVYMAYGTWNSNLRYGKTAITKELPGGH